MQNFSIYLVTAPFVSGVSAWLILRFVSWRAARRLIWVMSLGALMWFAVACITIEARYRLEYFALILMLYLPVLIAGVWSVIRRHNHNAD